MSEVGFEAAGFNDLSSGGSVPCSPAAGSVPVDSATHSVSAALTGLNPNTGYRFRLVGANANGSIATAASSVFETPGQPFVETTGSPLRTITTVRLDGRVNPTGAVATYHFEYGDQGPCDSNPCTSTTAHPVGVNEVQEITVRASGGKFVLSYQGQSTLDLAYNASASIVQSALSALPSIGQGNVAVSGGPGDLGGSKPYVVTFTGVLGALDVDQIQAKDGASPLITESGVSVKTTLSGGSSNEEQRVTVKATGGQFRLSFEGDTTADIPYNAAQNVVQAALSALPSIGPGNVAVGTGRGDATGAEPYVVTFVGALAETDVEQLTASRRH